MTATTPSSRSAQPSRSAISGMGTLTNPWSGMPRQRPAPSPLIHILGGHAGARAQLHERGHDSTPLLITATARLAPARPGRAAALPLPAIERAAWDAQPGRGFALGVAACLGPVHECDDGVAQGLLGLAPRTLIGPAARLYSRLGGNSGFF